MLIWEKSSFLTVFPFLVLVRKWLESLSIPDSVCPCTLFQRSFALKALRTFLTFRLSKMNTRHICTVSPHRLFWLMVFTCCLTGGTTRKPKCTIFCSACQKCHPPSSTFYAKRRTQTGRFGIFVVVLMSARVLKFAPLTIPGCACADTSPAASCLSTSATRWTAMRTKMLLLPSRCLIPFLETFCWAVILVQWLHSELLFFFFSDPGRLIHIVAWTHVSMTMKH